MIDKELLDTIEDFIANEYNESLTDSDKAKMFEHIIDLMEKRTKP